MAQMAVRSGTGPCLIQSYRPGEDPDYPPRTIYTVASWTFNPGVTQADLSGPHGTIVGVVPVSAQPTLTLSHMETPTPVQMGRLHGKNTISGAVAGTTIRVLDAFASNDDFKSVADLQTALRALSLVANPVIGVYEVDAEVGAGGTGAATVRRLSPAPALIEGTDLFTAFASAEILTLFGGSPAEGVTSTVVFAVEEQSDQGVHIDFREPTIMLHKILCWDGGEGNTSVYLSVKDAVASEASMAATRGEIATGETTYKILGGQADMTIVEFTRSVTGIPGVV